MTLENVQVTFLVNFSIILPKLFIQPSPATQFKKETLQNMTICHQSNSNSFKLRNLTRFLVFRNILGVITLTFYNLPASVPIRNACSNRTESERNQMKIFWKKKLNEGFHEAPAEFRVPGEKINHRKQMF